MRSSSDVEEGPDGARPSRRSGRPTMEDVAAHAGVSRALVSIVFRDVPGASQSTRERVRAAAAELGFSPDHRARLLGRSRSGLIGVAYGLRLTFHADLVEALYAAAEGSGYELVLSGIGLDRSEETALQSLLGYRCEALICLGPTLPAARLAVTAAAHPLVVVASRGGGESGLGVHRRRWRGRGGRRAPRGAGTPSHRPRRRWSRPWGCRPATRFPAQRRSSQPRGAATGPARWAHRGRRRAGWCCAAGAPGQCERADCCPGLQRPLRCGAVACGALCGPAGT